MIKHILTLFVFFGYTFCLTAGPDNIAPSAKVTASSVKSDEHSVQKAVDGLIGIDNKGEWASASRQTSWGAIDYPWIRLEWEKPKNINRIILYDRPTPQSHNAGGTLHFSDGTTVSVNQISNDGTAKAVNFPTKK